MIELYFIINTFLGGMYFGYLVCKNENFVFWRDLFTIVLLFMLGIFIFTYESIKRLLTKTPTE